MESRKKAGGADLRREARERKAAEREAARIAREAAAGSEGWGDEAEEGRGLGKGKGKGGAQESEVRGGELVVQKAEDGWRLDHFLVARLGGVSRARVQLLIEQGKVEVGAAEDVPENGEEDARNRKGRSEAEEERHSIIGRTKARIGRTRARKQAQEIEKAGAKRKRATFAGRTKARMGRTRARKKTRMRKTAVAREPAWWWSGRAGG